MRACLRAGSDLWQPGASCEAHASFGRDPRRISFPQNRSFIYFFHYMAYSPTTVFLYIKILFTNFRLLQFLKWIWPCRSRVACQRLFFVLGLLPEIGFLHEQFNREQLKCVKLESFISFVRGRVFIDQSVHLRKWNLRRRRFSPLYLQYLKVMGCSEKYSAVLLSDFNFSAAELIHPHHTPPPRTPTRCFAAQADCGSWRPRPSLSFPLASFLPFNRRSRLPDSFITPNGCDRSLTSCSL